MDIKIFAARNTSGYSLMELLVAVTIIGVLAAVAVPAYTKYTTKTRISTMWNESGAARLAVESDYNKFSTLNNSTYANGAAEFTTTGTDYIHSIAVTNVNGEVYVKVTGKTDSFAQKDMALTFTGTPKDGGIEWCCTPSNDAKDFVGDNCTSDPVNKKNCF